MTGYFEPKKLLLGGPGAAKRREMRKAALADPARRARGRRIVETHVRLLKADEHASNRRTVDGLMNYTDPGSLPSLLARTVREHGERSIRDLGDIFREAARRDRAMAGKLLDRFVDELRDAPEYLAPDRTAPKAGAGRNATPVRLDDALAGYASIVAGEPSRRAAADGGHGGKGKPGTPGAEKPPKPGEPKKPAPEEPDKPRPEKPEKPEKPKKPEPKKPDPCKVIRDTQNQVFDELLEVRQEIRSVEAELRGKEAELRELEALRPGDKIPGTEHMLKPRKLPIPSLPGRLPKRDGKIRPWRIFHAPVFGHGMEQGIFLTLQRMRMKEVKIEIAALKERLVQLRRKERNWEINVAELARRLSACEGKKG